MERYAKKRYERAALNSSQVVLLDLIYKYRFVSRQLLAKSLHSKAGSSLHERLEVLVKYGYIGKRLDKKLKLLGTPAAYFMLPRGLRMLRDQPGHDIIPESAVKAAYKDQAVGQAFINHTLEVYRSTLLLQHQYPELKVFTGRDMARYSYFPISPPDAFLSLSSRNTKQPARFFLDVVPETMPRYALERCISKYGEFFEEGGWEATGSVLPVMLLIAATGPAERRVRQSAAAQLSRMDSVELQIYTTTIGALDGLTAEPAAWTDVSDADELLRLADLA